MTPEAGLERTEAGVVPAGEGWFVVNAREARWRHAEGRGARLTFEGEPEFPQLGISLFVLAPGEPMGMYHWEADQEDFLVLSGEPLLIVEGEERPLRQWDFVHCAAGASHIIVGAGETPCAVLAVGSREYRHDPGWGGYPVDETALRHGAGVDRETTDIDRAYADLPSRAPIAYREGWLPAIPNLDTAATRRGGAGVDFKYELTVVPVSDVDRAKEFYADRLGFAVDVDHRAGDDFRVVQLTPPGSAASIAIGTGISSGTPGSYGGMHLVVSDIEAARDVLVDNGVEVSEPFHFGAEGQTPGLHPDRADYGTFASFEDPDGNGWLLQEVRERGPGR